MHGFSVELATMDGFEGCRIEDTSSDMDGEEGEMIKGFRKRDMY